ncbi:MAG TPA: metal-dependent transcriptional regulator, partial [Thermodesulfobacteriota bacterium]|nr:metal-dependent transcriptional regulator [Thermodesulfobacteriota bacterium]
IENYLKAIYEIQREKGKVSTNALSEKLRVAPASVTSMIKKLSEKKLLTHKRYQGVKLTQSGQKIALEVIRHHRLIELYLAEALGVPWDRVHEEAEKWEHVLSEDLEDRMDAALGHPTRDPHGSPIPSRDGTIIELDSVPLTDMRPGQYGVVAEVSDHDPKLLRYVGKMGLYPKAKVKVVSVEPFSGPITLKVGDASHVLGAEAAQHIFITDVKGNPGEAI